MSFIDEMRNLRSSIEDTKEKTKRAVKEIKQDTRGLRHEAQKLVDGFAEEQKANARVLRTDLERATQSLQREVKETRGANIREQGARRREFVQAQAAFWGKQKPEEKKKEKEEEKEE